MLGRRRRGLLPRTPLPRVCPSPSSRSPWLGELHAWRGSRRSLAGRSVPFPGWILHPHCRHLGGAARRAPPVVTVPQCACSLSPGVGSDARLIQSVDFSVDFLHKSRGCPPFGASALSALFLLVVPSILCREVFSLFRHPPGRFPPLARCWMVVRGSLDVLLKVAPSASKEDRHFR